MKVLAIAAIVTAAFLVALAPAIGAIYGDAYPGDSKKRAALAACSASEAGFSRLLAEDRAQCYARFLAAPPTEPARVPRREQVAGLG